MYNRKVSVQKAFLFEKTFLSRTKFLPLVPVGFCVLKCVITKGTFLVANWWSCFPGTHKTVLIYCEASMKIVGNLFRILLNRQKIQLQTTVWNILTHAV